MTYTLYRNNSKKLRLLKGYHINIISKESKKIYNNKNLRPDWNQQICLAHGLKTSCMLHSTPSNPWRIRFIFWNFSKPELIPKGNMLKQKRPHGLMNVVSGLDSHANFICQNLEFASSSENTLEPANLPSVVSSAGSGWFSLLTYSFSLLRSTQTLTSPVLFGVATMRAHQSVGWSTLDMTPAFSILSNSSFVF